MGLYDIGLTVTNDVAENERRTRADDAASAKGRTKPKKIYRRSDPAEAAGIGLVSILILGGAVVAFKRRGR